MSADAAIEMFVVGIVIDPRTQSPVVVLKNEAGDKYLPIWIGVPEATSIAEALKQLETTRPLTHDLMQNILNQAGMTVNRIVITDLKEATYYAEIYVLQGDKAYVFDARPSDAIALAVRFSAAIYVLDNVLKLAQIAFSHDAGDMSEEDIHGQAENETGDEGTGIPAESSALEQQDLRTIDKDQWAEILKRLNPDDFKYEM